MASARQDALRSATLLCDRCRRLSGCDVKEKFADPLPNGLLEAVEMKLELVEQMEENLREELDEEIPVSNKNTNLTPLLNAQRPPFDEASTLNGEQESDANSDTQFHPVGKRPRRGRLRRSAPYLTMPSSSPPRRGRPPKRPRYLDDYEADTSPSIVASPAIDEEDDDDGTWKPPAPASLEQLSVISTDDVLYEDEVEAFVDLKTKAKARGRPNGSYGGGKEPSTALIGRYSEPRRRGRPLRPDIRPQTTRTPPADEAVDAAHRLVDTPVAASGPGPIQSQQAAERLLAEISALSVARPLLRCALSKTVQSEAPNKLSEHHQHAHRTRRSVEVSKPSTSLYAYDLESLKELLTQGALPGGPREIVSQLRLLTMHWMACNRPGSRLYGCAQDVSAFLEKRLSELSGEKVGTASVASVPDH